MGDSPASAGRTRPLVVHVSGDFPDPLAPEKTPVIRSLLELTRNDFDHHVISLNRVNPALQEWSSAGRVIRRSHGFEAGEAMEYAAPPRGIFHATMLHRLGDAIAQRLEKLAPDLIVGHKLTIEGLVVARAAERLGIPFAVSVQGNTDLKILSARPDLRRRFRGVFHGAKAIFPFTPWALRAVEEKLGARSNPCHLLPCATDLDRPLTPRAGGNGLVSVFHLRHFRNKNLAGLAQAYGKLVSGGIEVPLTIRGGGNAQDMAACKEILHDHPGARLVGPSSRSDLPSELNEATGFVLVSHRESFGLVFVEALFAGLPIIYPRGAAIDGYFDGMPFAIGVDAHDPTALASAMERLVCDEVALKQALGNWQQSAEAQRFTREAIGAQFRDGLRQALAASTGEGHSKV